MESISKCCEAIYRHPFDKRKVMLCGGIVLVILVILVLYFVLSSGAGNDKNQAGSEALKTVPLVDGFNNLPNTLKKKVQNKLKTVILSDNLAEDKVLGSAACEFCKTDFARLRAGNVHAQFWSAGVPCASAGKDAVSQTLEQIDVIHRMVQKYNRYMFFGTSDYDIDSAQYYDKIANFISVDGGHSIDGRLGVLRMFYDLGVRSMSLTSECNTTWASSYKTTTTKGLTEFGKQVVAEMNRLGMIIDLSGTSYQTQIDVLNITKAPVIFSHSAAFSQLQNARNIKTDVLKKLKEKKGIIMITFEPTYVCATITSCTLNDVVDQINEIKSQLGDAENVGIGAAFDSYTGNYPTNLEDVSKYAALFDRLHNNGDSSWSMNDLEKLASRNFRRVMQDVEKVRDQMSDAGTDESYEPKGDIKDVVCYTDFEIRYTEQEKTSSPTASSATSSATVATELTVQSSITTIDPKQDTAPTPAPKPAL